MSCACGCGGMPKDPSKRYCSGHNPHPWTKAERNAEIRRMVAEGKRGTISLVARMTGLHRQTVRNIVMGRRKAA